MKKLFLAIILLSGALGAQAQYPGPNELHCTEEAITFKSNIGAGWRFSKPMIKSQPIDLGIASPNSFGPVLLPGELPLFLLQHTVLSKNNTTESLIADHRPISYFKADPISRKNKAIYPFLPVINFQLPYQPRQYVFNQTALSSSHQLRLVK